MKKGLDKILAFFIILIICALLCGYKKADVLRDKPIVVTVEACGNLYYLPKTAYGQVFGEAILKSDCTFVKTIAKKCYKKPENAAFYLDGENIKIRPSKLGRKIDEEKLTEDIKLCLSAGGGFVKCKEITLYPEFDESSLKKCDILRAWFSTDFSGSNKARINNLTLATNALSGVTVYTGEVFSFNEVVGERSEKFGYENAKVIVDGKYVDGVGGGVCQVSTTLYNAALLANLSVVEQHRHTLAVSYVEKSFDAMVSYGYADLKIKNDTGAPIFIVGKVEDETLTFYIYGKKQTATVERVSVLKKILKPNVEVVFSDLLEKGKSRTLVAPKNGYESEGYLIITDEQGKTEKFLRKDEYKKVDGLVEVGK